MEEDLYKLCDLLSVFLKLKKFQNEFETLRPLFDKCPTNLPLNWLKSLETDNDIAFNAKDEKERITESNNLRREGNQLFTAKGEHRNVLGACRLYNAAIFAVLGCETNVEELSLAFANRAMALQAFGYYQQAYDDCLCALEYGYPLSMRHKLVTRLAYCALKLKNIKAAEEHIVELQQNPLNDKFRNQLDDLVSDLESQKCLKINNLEFKSSTSYSFTRESQEIVRSSTEKGAYLRAKYDIPKNSLIFTEKASAVVPVIEIGICHQCCITNFIPYPCTKCRGRVVYCSLKCQKEHSSIHDYECAGYRFQLFSCVGIAHIALRIVLDNGIFTIVDHVKVNSNTQDVWISLSKGGHIASNKDLHYAESLRMISHMDKMDMKSITVYASISYVAVVYLKQYTTFFDDLCGKSTQTIDWELIVCALILRHIGQATVNAHTMTALSLKPLSFTKDEFHLLNEKMWSSPMHLKAGFLHVFSNIKEVAVLNLPYLSICNHSCIQSFQTKFSGRSVSNYALRDFKAGEDITNCYHINSRNSKSSHRREVLKTNFYFNCRCENCVSSKPDNDFNQYHQYRCDNKQCRQIFVPQMNSEFMDWWHKLNADANADKDTVVYCTKCGCKQRFKWHDEIELLVEKMTHVDARRRSYQIFKSLESTLLGLNNARAFIGSILCAEWFYFTRMGITLNDVDYQEIGAMSRYAMECRKSQMCVNSNEYIVEMVYLWDVIALGKYTTCSTEDIDEMIFALEILSDDFKVIFRNYFNAYIKDKVMSCK